MRMWTRLIPFGIIEYIVRRFTSSRGTLRMNSIIGGKDIPVKVIEIDKGEWMVKQIIGDC